MRKIAGSWRDEHIKEELEMELITTQYGKQDSVGQKRKTLIFLGRSFFSLL